MRSVPLVMVVVFVATCTTLPVINLLTALKALNTYCQDLCIIISPLWIIWHIFNDFRSAFPNL